MDKDQVIDELLARVELLEKRNGRRHKSYRWLEVKQDGGKRTEGGDFVAATPENKSGCRFFARFRTEEDVEAFIPDCEAAILLQIEEHNGIPCKTRRHR